MSRYLDDELRSTGRTRQGIAEDGGQGSWARSNSCCSRGRRR